MGLAVESHRQFSLAESPHAAGCCAAADRYGVEAMYFDSSVRAEHHADLAAKLTATVSGPFKTQLNLLVAELMGEFDKNFRLAILDNASGAFAAIAARMSANTLATFDERAQEFLVAGTNLTGTSQQPASESA